MIPLPTLPRDPRGHGWDLGQVIRIGAPDDSIQHHLECQLPSTQCLINQHFFPCDIYTATTTPFARVLLILMVVLWDIRKCMDAYNSKKVPQETPMAKLRRKLTPQQPRGCQYFWKIPYQKSSVLLEKQDHFNAWTTTPQHLGHLYPYTFRFKVLSSRDHPSKLLKMI